jgi:hypothetical protein
MTVWAFVLTPLLVLPIMVLFRFVGCAKIAGLESPDPTPAQPPPQPTPEKVPRYRDFIMGAPNNPGTVKNPKAVPKNADDIIAYWRLADPAAAPDVAVDEKGFRNGEYRSSANADTIPGNFITGQPGLIVSDPKALCRFFNGGFVFVPFKDGLYTDEFTIEAWIRPGFPAGSEHTLFKAGGHYVRPFESTAKYHGFQIFAINNRWQVALAPVGAVFSAPPIIPSGVTHLAVTVENASPGGATKKVTLFMDGKVTGLATTTGFYSRPDGAPLLIGVGSGKSDPTDLTELLEPTRSHVQEVVLHRRALPLEEVENHVDINRT